MEACFQPQIYIRFFWEFQSLFLMSNIPALLFLTFLFFPITSFQLIFLCFLSITFIYFRFFFLSIFFSFECSWCLGNALLWCIVFFPKPFWMHLLNNKNIDNSFWWTKFVLLMKPINICLKCYGVCEFFFNILSQSCFLIVEFLGICY